MKKINSKGFTLIELLAVITIMGILMLVAIPAVSRTIENSRRDTFADVAKTYINTVRNAVTADELECTVGSDTVSVGATEAGDYYFALDSASSQNTKDLMESGGKSSWGNNDVKGYVAWTKTASGSGFKTEYSVVLVDKANHGVVASDGTAVAEKDVTRSKVLLNTSSIKAYGTGSFVPANTADKTYKVCTLK